VDMQDQLPDGETGGVPDAPGRTRWRGTAQQDLVTVPHAYADVEDRRAPCTPRHVTVTPTSRHRRDPGSRARHTRVAPHGRRAREPHGQTGPSPAS
jgi:hypothetical protein